MVKGFTKRTTDEGLDESERSGYRRKIVANISFFFFFLEMVDQTIANRRRLFQSSLFVASM